MKNIKIIASFTDKNGNRKSLILKNGVFSVEYNRYNWDYGVKAKSVKQLKELCILLNNNNVDYDSFGYSTKQAILIIKNDYNLLTDFKKLVNKNTYNEALRGILYNYKKIIDLDEINYINVYDYICNTLND